MENKLWRPLMGKAERRIARKIEELTPSLSKMLWKDANIRIFVTKMLPNCDHIPSFCNFLFVSRNLSRHIVKVLSITRNPCTPKFPSVIEQLVQRQSFKANTLNLNILNGN